MVHCFTNTAHKVNENKAIQFASRIQFNLLCKLNLAFVPLIKVRVHFSSVFYGKIFACAGALECKYKIKLKIRNQLITL